MEDLLGLMLVYFGIAVMAFITMILTFASRRK